MTTQPRPAVAAPPSDDIERRLASAEDRLAELAWRYRLLAENSSDVVLHEDASGVVTWASPSLTTTLGWRPADVLGRRVDDLMHPADLAELAAADDDSDPDAYDLSGDLTADLGGDLSPGLDTDLPSALDADLAADLPGLPVGDPGRTEARYAMRPHGWRWMSATRRPLPPNDGRPAGAVHTLRDIHAEMESRQGLASVAVRLARSERRFRLAMASAPVGMAVVDAELRFLDVNPALGRMLGRDEEWLLSHGVPDVLDPRDRWSDLRLRADVLTGRAESATATHRLVTADGRTLVVEHSVGALADQGGQPHSYVSQFVDVTEAHSARARLQFLASHDALTSLANRRELTDRMDQILGHPPRTGTRLGVLFIDVDDFKPVNDRYGHATGDSLLVQVAERISEQVRTDDLVARIGGDEFVVALPSVHTLDDVTRIADKIVSSFGEPLCVEGRCFDVTVSVGAAVADPGDHSDRVLALADQALYRAKREGRNRAAAYDLSLDG